jgi:hypothetical protein
MTKLIFIISIILLIAAGFIGCHNSKNVDTNACAANDPMEEVPWIEELKTSMTNCSCEISIIKGTYRGQTVVFTALTDPLCNGISTPILYNCEGKEITRFTDSPSDQEELRNNVRRESILFRCKK